LRLTVAKGCALHRYAAQRTTQQNPKRLTKALLRRLVQDLNEAGLVDLIPKQDVSSPIAAG
jgi:hypothetical protein